MTEEIRMEPFDEFNRELVGHVHPPDWVNPQPAGRYHLVAIGAGTAGLVSAGGAAGVGARAALIERHLMGGDCLNVGCVPSKGIISAARAWHAAREARARCGGPEAIGAGDFGAAMQRMRRLRAGIAPHDSAERFRDLGVDVYLGGARFTGPDTIEVDGRTLRFRRAVIATGGRAAAPPIPGLEEAGYLTNETFFSLTELPRRLGVIGGGPIGCEMAQSFARFGSKVTVFEMADRVMPREDPDASSIVAEALRHDGVDLRLGVKVVRVDCRGEQRIVTIETEGQTVEIPVDELLVAVGRKPNVEGLGLEAAGVEYDRAGVIVDDRLRTTNRRIFAAGDVASKFQFTHTADAQARIVLQNALFFGRARNSGLVVSWCTYTSPEVAHVGMTAQEAEESEGVESLTIPMSGIDRAVLDGESDGFLRVYHRRGRPLGATMVAAHAGDMIGEMALAITHRIGLAGLSGTIHPYPTQGEVMRKLGDQYRRGSLTPRVKRLFGLWFRLLGFLG